MKICDLALYSPETSSGVKTYIASKIAYARSRVDIEHVVILIQENRSFDHYFGMYPGADGFTLDNIGVNTGPVPEPASILLSILAAPREEGPEAHDRGRRAA